MAGAARASGGAVSLDMVFPVEVLERRILYLKSRVAWLAYRSRDVRVVRVASELLASLTELLEDLDEGVPVAGVLPRLGLLEGEVEAFLQDPEGYASSRGDGV